MTVANTRDRAAGFMTSLLTTAPQPMTCAELASHLVDAGLRNNVPSLAINTSALLRTLCNDPDSPVTRREATPAEQVRITAGRAPVALTYLYWAQDTPAPERRFSYLGGTAQVVSHPRRRDLPPAELEVQAAKVRLTQLRSRRAALNSEIRELEQRLGA